MTALTGSEPIVVDSSGWLEYFTSDSKGELFEPYLREPSLVVPTIVLYEVRKVLLVRHTNWVAETFISEALRHTVVPVDQYIALSAATISIQYKLAMADALVYTTASTLGAKFITADSHFAELPGVTLL